MAETAASRERDLRLLFAYLVYLAGLVLACAGLFTGWPVAATGLAGLALGTLFAWAVRRGAGGDWRASHGTWLFRMFWVLAFLGVFAWFGRIWFFGGPMLLLLWLWALWRLGKGLLRWRENRAIERPEAWF